MNEKEIKELEYYHFTILNQLINLALSINANITKRVNGYYVPPGERGQKHCNLAKD